MGVRSEGYAPDRGLTLATPPAKVLPKQLPARVWGLMRMAYERGWACQIYAQPGQVLLTMRRGDRKFVAAWAADADDPHRWVSTSRAGARDLPTYPLETTSGLDDVEAGIRSSR